MAVELHNDGNGSFPDEHIADNDVFEAPGLSTDSSTAQLSNHPPPEWRRRCPKDEWHFVSKSVYPGIKGHLEDIRLVLYVRNPSMVKSQPTNYRDWIPQKLRDKRKIKTSLERYWAGALLYTSSSIILYSGACAVV